MVVTVAGVSSGSRTGLRTSSVSGAKEDLSRFVDEGVEVLVTEPTQHGVLCWGAYDHRPRRGYGGRSPGAIAKSKATASRSGASKRSAELVRFADIVMSLVLRVVVVLVQVKRERSSR